MSKNTYDGLLYACGTGKQKKWARETLIMDMLYDTSREDAVYLRFDDISLLDKCDEETDEYYIYKFGYLYRLPKTEVDIKIYKKDNKIILEKVGVGFGYDNVEDCVYKFIEEQINKKNLYLRTNLNDSQFLIK